MLKSLKSKALKENGQGLVEYALVLPIFLMLVFVIIDYSTILYDKIAFNMALRDSIVKLEFSEEETKALQNYLNPYGPVENRFGHGYDLQTGQIQNRGKDFYMDHKFLSGLTTEEYIKREIEKRDPNINIDNIEFLDFEKGRQSRIGIYSGLQHYHYKKNYGADGRNFQSNPTFSTTLIAQIRVNYKIEPKGALMKSLYPDGLIHEKTIYKTSRNMRWNPTIKNPHVPDELDN